MSDAGRRRALATAADLAALPDEARVEILDGEIIEKAAPSFEHSEAQSALIGFVRGGFHGGGGGESPGGWWLVTECEIELEPHQVFRPDLVGWRRARVPERPSGRPIRTKPDWVCEVLSPSNASTDLVRKFHVLQGCAVPHHWIVDPERETLTAYRWTEGDYLVALQADRAATVRAQPFEALELRVGVQFGDDAG